MSTTDGHQDARLLRPVHRPLRQHRHRGGRPFHAARSRSHSPDRPGALRQGPRRAGAGLQQASGSPGPCAAPGRRARPTQAGWRSPGTRRWTRRRRRCGGWPQAHGPQSVAFSQSSPSTTAIGDSAPLPAQADERLRHAEPRLGAGHVRLGPRLRHALRVRRRERRHRQRRRGDGGHREQRLPDPLGLQPLLHAPDARDRDRRGAEARDEAHRHRSAPCRARRQGRSLAARSPRHRRRARARARACDDQPRLVRPRVRAEPGPTRRISFAPIPAGCCAPPISPKAEMPVISSPGTNRRARPSPTTPRRAATARRSSISPSKARSWLQRSREWSRCRPVFAHYAELCAALYARARGGDLLDCA